LLAEIRDADDHDKITEEIARPAAETEQLLVAGFCGYACS